MGYFYLAPFWDLISDTGVLYALQPTTAAAEIVGAVVRNAIRLLVYINGIVIDRLVS